MISRRSILSLLGLAPAAPALARLASAEAPSIVGEMAGTLDVGAMSPVSAVSISGDMIAAGSITAKKIMTVTKSSPSTPGIAFCSCEHPRDCHFPTCECSFVEFFK